MLPTPRSLRGQFAIALVVLTLLILGGGLAAVLALRSASEAARELAEERLVRMQKAQDLLQRTLMVERGTNQLLETESLATVRSSYADIVVQLEALDLQVQGLAGANGEASMLDLHQSSQLFRNTANVVAQLRGDMLLAGTAFSEAMQGRAARLGASEARGSSTMALLLYRLQGADNADAVARLRTLFSIESRVALAAIHPRPADRSAVTDQIADEPDPFSLRLKFLNERDTLARFHEELRDQAEALVAAARLQSAALDSDYRQAMADLVRTATRNQNEVLLLLAGSLVFAWLVVRTLILRNLGQVYLLSRYLRHSDLEGSRLQALANGRDEISEMARAVQQFLADRGVLVHRTDELSFAREQLIEQGRVLEMIAKNARLRDVLERVTHLIEAQILHAMCSVLLLDSDGVHLRHGAAPSLPDDYVKAIDGVRIGDRVGSCGTAVQRRAIVIVTDIQQDPLWADFRVLAARYGLRSCWSAPIFASNGAVLGTFAVYSHEVRAPTPAELLVVELATRIAGIAIERQQAEERIQRMAHYDELTGLPNRNLLTDRLGLAIAHAQRYKRCVTVAFLDLDNFKLVNDSLGHSAGDALLKIVSERMLQCVRATDSVLRLGGDEFLIILPDQLAAPDVIEPALRRIIDSIARPIRLGDREVEISCSMGLATYPTDGTTTRELLMNADAAMYRAKELGRNNFQFYRSEMNASNRERMLMLEGLRHAIERGELFLLYQPQVDLLSGRVCGVEALVRWQHPKLGLVGPVVFIPVAEANGLIGSIGDWVLRTACLQCKAWQDAGLPRITMSVNVSARQFRDNDWLGQVEATLRECGLEARYLELELTESMLMLDALEAARTMRRLRTTGARLAIDDFGTGYSSLGALKAFPINRLKIDRSFVMDIATDQQDGVIVSAVIGLAHQLHLEVIAEGVETAGQLAFLREHGCDQIQGFYFSEPAAANSIPALLAPTGIALAKVPLAA